MKDHAILDQSNSDKIIEMGSHSGYVFEGKTTEINTEGIYRR